MKKLTIGALAMALFLALMLLFTPMLVHAQHSLPGNGCDPYDGCPSKVNNWVLIFGFASLICLMYHTGKK